MTEQDFLKEDVGLDQDTRTGGTEGQKKVQIPPSRRVVAERHRGRDRDWYGEVSEKKIAAAHASFIKSMELRNSRHPKDQSETDS